MKQQYISRQQLLRYVFFFHLQSNSLWYVRFNERGEAFALNDSKFYLHEKLCFYGISASHTFKH